MCLGTTLTAGGFAWVPRALRGLLWRVMRKGAVRGDLAADRATSAAALRNVALAHMDWSQPFLAFIITVTAMWTRFTGMLLPLVVTFYHTKWTASASAARAMIS